MPMRSALHGRAGFHAQMLHGRAGFHAQIKNSCVASAGCDVKKRLIQLTGGGDGFKGEAAAARTHRHHGAAIAVRLKERAR
jgi:hypothetical protein